ncbi:MAG: hypothetical protein PCFJNLEI_02213 [Verrucomicrobiae bacterium]|nr:hypothetical protein [Verrucomicrobiae bacterium]
MKNAQVVPFFVLNHQLDIPYLRQCVRAMAAAGVDGFFLHPREGLLTPYLSEEWFAAIGACIAEAKKTGIKAWLYDEFPYPSGVAGGKVVASNPTFAERHLRIQRHRLTAGHHRVVLGHEPVLAAFLVRGQQARDVTAHIGPFNDTWIKREWDSRYYYDPHYAKLYDCPRSSASHPQAAFEGTVPAGHWELVVFTLQTGGDFVEPFGHYVDVSNRAATQEFLNVTHAQYYRRFGKEFGKTIPGIFTDEPKYRNTLPWSDAIAAAWPDYQKDRRALLSLAGPGNSECRLRYRQATLRLFRENWAQPIATWCRQHSLNFTGHISPEEQWLQEAALCGSIAQILKTFHLPGCDLIIPAVGDRAHPILNFIPTLAASVAAQNGCPQAGCELFGANGFQLNLQDMKRIAEWLASLGINFFVNHGLFGWLDGYRKYDAPPTMYKPSTLWPHFKDWADTVRTTAERLGPGNIRTDVVIVRPMRTLWRLGNARGAVKIYETAMRLALQLQERGVPFHWVDDLDLPSVRRVGRRIQIGKASYRHLIHLPGTLDAEALRHVRRLKQTGTEAGPGPLHSRSGNIRATPTKAGDWFLQNLAPRAETFTLQGQSHRLEGYETRWLDAPPPPPSRLARVLPGDWQLRPASDNVLVLQHWTLNGKPTKLAPYYDAVPQNGAVDQVALGLIPTNPKMPKAKTLVYRTRFRCRGVRTVQLVIEGETIRGEWIATCNGRPLTQWKKVYRYDPTNREHILPVRAGMNELTFTVTIEKSSDGMIDPCRLYGDFLVKGGTLVARRTLRGTGDWCRLGFPHYSGTMIHTQDFRWEKIAGQRVELVLTRPPRDHVVVMLNGRPAGKLLWSPWRLDITSALRTGTNRLELHVTNTLTNLMYGQPRPSGLNGDVTLATFPTGRQCRA